MKLLRVQIPEYRVLKDIDLVFEKDFHPNIFPLASQNGGGKSTLLQLIFVLLSCSFDPKKQGFLKNMLQSFPISSNSEEKLLAKFDLWDEGKTVEVEFFCIPDEIQKEKNTETQGAIFYRTNIEDREKVDSFFKKLSQKVFLSAPFTQMILFLSLEERKCMLQEGGRYHDILERVKSELPGFFSYEVLASKSIIESLKTACDQDFIEKTDSGNFGTRYQILLNELNAMLDTGKISVKKDFSELIFKIENQGKTVKLLPEDLSHGELKRISLYAWIKQRNIKDAIVLMDNVEIAHHPDWQYQIVSDLKKWSPDSQFILTTHSNELCEALTPAHVKELDKKSSQELSSSMKKKVSQLTVSESGRKLRDFSREDAYGDGID